MICSLALYHILLIRLRTPPFHPTVQLSIVFLANLAFWYIIILWGARSKKGGMCGYDVHPYGAQLMDKGRTGSIKDNEAFYPSIPTWQSSVISFLFCLLSALLTANFVYKGLIWLLSTAPDPLQADMIPLLQIMTRKAGAGEYLYNQNYDAGLWGLRATYLPGLWIPHLLMRFLRIDLRVVTLLSGILAGAAITFMLPKNPGNKISATVSFLIIIVTGMWFLQPCLVKFIFISHTGPFWVILSLWGLSVWFQRPVWAGAMLGLALATRPFGVALILPHFLWLFQVTQGLRCKRFWKSFAATALVWGFIILPFLTPHPKDYYISTVRFYSVDATIRFKTGKIINMVGLTPLLYRIGWYKYTSLIFLVGYLAACLPLFRRRLSSGEILLLAGLMSSWMSACSPFIDYYIYFEGILLASMGCAGIIIEEYVRHKGFISQSVFPPRRWLQPWLWVAGTGFIIVVAGFRYAPRHLALRTHPHETPDASFFSSDWNRRTDQLWTMVREMGTLRIPSWRRHSNQLYIETFIEEGFPPTRQEYEIRWNQLPLKRVTITAGHDQEFILEPPENEILRGNNSLTLIRKSVKYLDMPGTQTVTSSPPHLVLKSVWWKRRD